MNRKQNIHRVVSLAKRIGAANLTMARACDAIHAPHGSFYYRFGMSFAELARVVRDHGAPEFTSVGVSRAKLSAPARKEHLIQVGLRLGRAKSISRIYLADIARAAEVSVETLRHYFGSVQSYRKLVLQAAHERGEAAVIEQATR